MEATWLIRLLVLGAVAVAAVPSEDKKVGGKAAPAEEKKLSEKATALADRSATLAFNLYHVMAKQKDMENILVSPVVVASSLGLVSLGGKAATASQAKALLSADKLNDDFLHSGLSELLSELSNATARNVTWKIGSRLYGPSSISFAEDFVKSSKKHYNYEHSKINFRDKRSALKSINEWAAQTTGGKLPEVTKDVEKTDGALIVNAMFFKREWEPGAGPDQAGGFQLSAPLRLAKGLCWVRPSVHSVPGSGTHRLPAGPSLPPIRFMQGSASEGKASPPVGCAPDRATAQGPHPRLGRWSCLPCPAQGTLGGFASQSEPLLLGARQLQRFLKDIVAKRPAPLPKGLPPPPI